MAQNTRCFKTDVITYDSTQGLHPIEQSLYYPGDDTPTGIGKFIDKKAYDYYIRETYTEDLTKLNNDKNAEVSDELILFEIGKTVLLMLLAQQDCEGIRLTQISKKEEDASTKKSFIVQGIQKIHDDESPKVAKAVIAIDGSGGVMTEEIHGLNLKDVYKILEAHSFKDENLPIENLIKLLW